MNIIKSTLYIGTIAFMMIGFTTDGYAEKMIHSYSEHHAEEQVENKTIMGTGVVNKIMLDTKKLNITHGPIEALNWPAMTMDFVVGDDVDLNNVVENESINFHIEKNADNSYVVTNIMKSVEKVDMDSMKTLSEEKLMKMNHNSDNHEH